VLHGRGADEFDLLEPAAAAAPGFAIASLRGPIDLGGGYTWFENRGPGRPLGASLRASADAIWEWLAGVDSARYDRTRVTAFGFSAGMLMAGALLLDRPDAFAGAVLLSGTLPWDNDAIVPTPGRLAGKPVFHAHGRHDDVIPAEMVARTDTYLRTESGALVRSLRYDMPHAVVDREIADIATWLAER
jgi:phospholipase/carboxylesterase